MPTEAYPWLAAMAVLLICSGFFSASEAAMFLLRWPDRRILQAGNRAMRRADQLLEDPDRLLSAVLFWNLVVNILYFALASRVALAMDDGTSGGKSRAALFGCAALLGLIFGSEMLPKSLAVTMARQLAAQLSLPLSLFVRVLDPLMPILRTVNLLSQRLIWPGFHSEPYLQVSDLERAIHLSTGDAQLIEQEQSTLRHLVGLSETRVEEWMRPRSHFVTFQPPVALQDLQGRMTPSGYLLITEADNEEVAAALDLRELSDVPAEHLEHLAQPVVTLPWCATAAQALDLMQREERSVTAVVNEFGETVGILTLDDILDIVFSPADKDSDQLWNRSMIREMSPGVWQVSGITSLRQLEREFGRSGPPCKSVTVTGCIQEELQRIARVGDEAAWGPYRFRVLRTPVRGLILAELRLAPSEAAS